MKPILMVWADADAVASASPSAAANAASLFFFMSLLLEKVARVLARILVDRLGGPRLCLEHRGERRAVELVARRFAARRMRLHQHAHAALLGDADPGLQ